MSTQQVYVQKIEEEKKDLPWYIILVIILACLLFSYLIVLSIKNGDPFFIPMILINGLGNIFKAFA